MMRLSWVRPDVAERVRAFLLDGRASWEQLFEGDTVRAGEPPAGVTPAAWPGLAAHIARVERVREVVGRAGLPAAVARFGASPHAVERAALVAEGAPDDDVGAIAGILGCRVDEWLVYGQFLSRLVELGVERQPAATVTAFEAFVRAAEAAVTVEPSWPERVRAARDGLASLYVRVGDIASAESLYATRFAEEPEDTTIAIGAARAFLDAGEHSRAVAWLERAAGRAEEIGRPGLAATLRHKVTAVRGRLN